MRFVFPLFLSSKTLLLCKQYVSSVRKNFSISIPGFESKLLSQFSKVYFVNSSTFVLENS
ncbi:hypothetical protein A0128_11480 [Leptospira tipperaryensis]|uniref:Uncharacterized protein n=1 Tax=Leptospira tipperaryensis TaxID=2564040 RepID=A0A1D7UXY1_9LEPT|nr:hypothetical protein A0128_11480 [Leptospira tipperaryensis]